MDYKLKLSVGNDNGNSEHDIIIDNELITQPNVISKVRKAPNVEELNNNLFIKNIENNLIVDILSDAVKTGTYLCGNYALKSGEKVKSISIGYDNNKLESDIVIVNTLAQIAGYSVKQAHKDNKLTEDTRIIVSVDMATALPISQYSKSRAKEFANRFLEGKHIVKVSTPKSKVVVEIEFDFVKVIQEGVTTIFALLEAEEKLFETYNKENEEDKIDKTYFEDKKILHIAIGEGTTEYPVTEGRIFNPNFIKGTNNGVGHAINSSLEEFKEECGQTSLSRQKYSEILKDEKHKFNLVAKDIIDIYLENQAEEIFENAKQEIDKANNEIDMIVVYGGGSILMRNSLEPKLKKICEKGKIKLLYIDAEYAVTLEGKGLYAFVKSDIFKKIKQLSKNN